MDEFPQNPSNIVKVNGQNSSISITSHLLTVQGIKNKKDGTFQLDSKTKNTFSIPLGEILFVKKIAITKLGCCQETIFPNNAHKISSSQEISYKEDNNGFLICSVKSRQNKWSLRKTWVQCDNYEEWLEIIKMKLHPWECQRPSRLLIFINPIGGSKKGPDIYFSKVAPLFKLVGICTQVIVTERENHAQDYILDNDISSFDGVVCVGGDGMYSELVHGLLLRSRRMAGYSDENHGPDSIEIRPDIRLGIIAAGSTDAVAFSTMGTKDPVTSALHIILGDCLGVDIMTVHCGDSFVRYNISFLGYGFYGDLIAESETLRWMGPSRYNYLGLKKYLANQSYPCEISYLPSDNTDSTPQDSVICQNNCSVCSEALNSSDILTSHDNNSEWKIIRGRFTSITSLLISCRCLQAPAGVSTNCHLGDGCIDLILVTDCSRMNFLRFLCRTAWSGSRQFHLNYVKVERVKKFKFTPLPQGHDIITPHPSSPPNSTSFISTNQSHRPAEDPLDKSQFPIGSNVAFESGISGNDMACSEHVMIEPPEVDRNIETDDSNHSSDQLLTTSITSHSRWRKQKGYRDKLNEFSIWNCDGETLPCLPITCQSHCQLIRLFARGIQKKSVYNRNV